MNLTTEQMKAKIDNMSYLQMLSRWRFAEVGSPWFVGEVGEYFKQAFFKARKETNRAELVAASKDVGWEK
jgi:hypothetical protein